MALRRRPRTTAGPRAQHANGGFNAPSFDATERSNVVRGGRRTASAAVGGDLMTKAKLLLAVIGIGALLVAVRCLGTRQPPTPPRVDVGDVGGGGQPLRAVPLTLPAAMGGRGQTGRPEKHQGSKTSKISKFRTPERPRGSEAGEIPGARQTRRWSVWSRPSRGPARWRSDRDSSPRYLRGTARCRSTARPFTSSSRNRQDS